MGWKFYNASGQQLRNTSTVLATQAEMEAGSSTSAFVTPGRTQYHPGVAKAYYTAAGDGTLQSNSHNITSLSRDGTGDYTVTWATDFANVNYAVSITSSHGSDINDAAISNIRAAATGTLRYGMGTPASPSVGNDQDHDVIAFGDQ